MDDKTARFLIAWEKAPWYRRLLAALIVRHTAYIYHHRQLIKGYLLARFLTHRPFLITACVLSVGAIWIPRGGQMEDFTITLAILLSLIRDVQRGLLVVPV